MKSPNGVSAFPRLDQSEWAMGGVTKSRIFKMRAHWLCALKGGIFIWVAPIWVVKWKLLKLGQVEMLSHHTGLSKSPFLWIERLKVVSVCIFPVLVPRGNQTHNPDVASAMLYQLTGLTSACIYMHYHEAVQWNTSSLDNSDWCRTWIPPYFLW